MPKLMRNEKAPKVVIYNMDRLIMIIFRFASLFQGTKLLKD